ncbi:MAG: guanylate kinase [Zoogloeaceae bacterium]|jgi:guanylate kinase|nr:guanylate kinase [Zoogloeaceae bacterium]
MSACLFIVTAASGAGKTTLVRGLLAQEAGVALSISHTTRPPRPSEADGREYHFVDTERFHALMTAGEFLEHALVHGNHYGTSRRWIEARLAAGEDVLLEIDWQGAQQVRRVFSEAIGIFILPPSLEALAQRLAGRGMDSAEVIARRLAAARAEMRHVHDFHYVIINDDLQIAVQDLARIVRASRLARPLTLASQRARHAALFAELT